MPVLYRGEYDRRAAFEVHSPLKGGVIVECSARMECFLLFHRLSQTLILSRRVSAVSKDGEREFRPSIRGFAATQGEAERRASLFHTPSPGASTFHTPLTRGGRGGWFSGRGGQNRKGCRDRPLCLSCICVNLSDGRILNFTPPLRRGSRRSRAVYAKADAVGGKMRFLVSPTYTPHRIAFGLTPSALRLPLKGGVDLKFYLVERNRRS